MSFPREHYQGSWRLVNKTKNKKVVRWSIGASSNDLYTYCSSDRL